MATYFVSVIILLLGLLAIANAHPILMDGALLGTMQGTPFVNVLLENLKQSALQHDIFNIAGSLTATVLGGGIAMYLT